MKALVTLATLAALTAGSLRAQAQFTVDGTLGANELGTGVGKYQLAGTYTGAHSVADRGLKAVYVGTTATTLNIFVVASPERAAGGEYSALVLYLAVPNKTGIAAGVRLPGSSNGSSQLRHRPTLDMATAYGFRITMSPLGSNDNNIYLSRVDYTVAAQPSGQYAEIGMGQGQKNGTVTTDSNDPALMRTAPDQRFGQRDGQHQHRLGI